MKKALYAFCFTVNLFLFYQSSAQTGNAPYTIPVVFHIVHNNGPENIPDSLIIQSLSRINDNFNMRNVALSGVASPFVSMIADMQISFCLSQTDPQGNATTGIERIQNTLTYYGDSPAVKIDQWPHDKYFNIWVVDSLVRDDHKRGYALYPSQAAINPALDGAVVPYTVFETGNAGDGILTNIIGHYLNLSNIWGNTYEPEVACGDDDIYDTPITKGTTICDTSQAICGPNTVTIIENIQNFMDWSPCVCMFTNGQKQWVHAALDTTIGGRNNLWSTANLAVTCNAATGLEQLDANKIIVTPNPFTAYVTISGIENVEQSFVVYDVTGRIVWSQSNVPSEHRVSLDLSLITTGVYFLDLAREKKILKIVKSK